MSRLLALRIVRKLDVVWGSGLVPPAVTALRLLRPTLLRPTFALAALVAICGCEPERPLKPVQTAQATKSAQSTKTQSATGQQDNKPAQGPITVDEDGYVTLGPAVKATPEPAAPSPPVQPEVAKSTSADTDKIDLSPANSIAGRVSSTLESAANIGSTTDKPKDTKLPEADATGVTKKYDEKNQSIAEDWPKPQALLFITGQQHGYIEPCGCTGWRIRRVV